MRSLSPWTIFSVIVTAILASLVFTTDYLPGVDIPQHAGQLAAFYAVEHGTFPFGNLFRINWFNPYWIGYACILLIHTFLGLSTSIKIVAWLALVALPLSVSYTLKAYKTDPRLCLLVLPTLFGFSFQWGFLNFYIAAPLAIFFLGFFYKSLNDTSKNTLIAIGLFINVIFFAHALIWAFTMAASFLLCLLTTSIGWEKRKLKIYSMLSSLILFVLWYRNTVPSSIHGMYGLVIMDYGIDRFYGVLNSIGLRDKKTNLILLSLIFLAPGFFGYSFSRVKEKYIPLALVLMIMIFVPSEILDIAFLYQRFSIFLIPSYLLVIERTHDNQRKKSYVKYAFILYGTTLILFYWIMWGEFLEFQQESKGFTAILEQMKPNQRVLMLEVNNQCNCFNAPVFLHFPVWYQANKNGMVDFNTGVAYSALMRLKHVDTPANIPGIEWNPLMFNYSFFRPDIYSYYIVRSHPAFLGYLFRNSHQHVHLIQERNGWWLYKNDTLNIQMK